MDQIRKNAEAEGFRALRQNPETLQELLDSIVCGILTTDRRGRITFTNNSARKILGRSREELVGSSFESLAWNTLDGAPLPTENYPFARALESGETVRGEIYSVGDGGEGRLYFSVDVVPLQDGRGEIQGSAADFTDISTGIRFQEERNRLIAALQESEARYRLLTEAAPVGVYECDGRGCWLYLNPRWTAISGRSEEESLGFRWLQAVHPEDQAEFLAAWRQSVDQPGVWEREFRLLHPAGRTVWVRTLRQEIPARHDGRRFVGTVEDITARQETLHALARAKEAAEEASEAKSRFLSVISHEIRTPMTIFMGMLELTMAGAVGPEERRYLETAERAADSLLTLIEDILLFSDLEAGRLDLDWRPFELQRCVREAVATAAAEARQKGLAFRLELAHDLPPEILGDPGRLRQVLINLVGNAVKFTDRGEIELRIEKCGNCLDGSEGVRFAVRDTGIGIDLEKLNLLFHPFTQMDDSATRRFGGTGLGLAISKGLIEAMGGKIEVERSTGQGSIFAFTIPPGNLAVPPPPISAKRANLLGADHFPRRTRQR